MGHPAVVDKSDCNVTSLKDCRNLSFDDRYNPLKDGAKKKKNEMDGLFR